MMKYLLAYTIPLATYTSLTSGGAFSWLTLLYAFGLLPLVELFTKGSKVNKDPGIKAIYFDLLLYSMLPIQLGLSFLFFIQMHSGVDQSFWVIAGKISAMAISNGVLGINVAHELGHRKKIHEKLMALTLLCSTLYMHFYIEHNKSHHKNVSTPLDHASAERGISLYRFLARSFYQSFKSAFKVDRKQTLLFAGIELCLCALIFFIFDPMTLVYFLISSFGGALLLEGVNYIEHYGLRRRLNPSGRYEKVDPKHSWNSNHPLSRIILFELSRHSDHHANADRPYQLLRNFDEAPELPTGYPGMLLLAAIPKLWFKTMHPMLDTH
ncbi:MAG: alkane 1-monooxygenase [Bacteriovoracaceae bacterium]|jgi:alkane 1-monooxygenase